MFLINKILLLKFLFLQGYSLFHLFLGLATLLPLLRVVHDELAIAGEALGTYVDVLGAGVVVESDRATALHIRPNIGVPVECAAVVSCIGQGTLGVISLVELTSMAVTLEVGDTHIVLRLKGRFLGSYYLLI